MKNPKLKAQQLQDKTINAYRKFQQCLDEIDKLLPTYEGEPTFIIYQTSGEFYFCWDGGRNSIVTTYALENLIRIKIQQNTNPTHNFDAEINKLLSFYLI